jgi:hypothetical protein
VPSGFGLPTYGSAPPEPFHTWSIGGHEVAGLRIDYPHEFPLIAWEMNPFLVEAEPRTWRLPGPWDGKLPPLFSLEATKP